VAGHLAMELAGPDPSDPSKTVTMAVTDWFRQPVTAFMQALANPANGWIVPGDASSSRFVNELLSGGHPMGRVFSEVAPGTAHTTWRSIAVNWINAGCPIPSEGFAATVPPRQRLAPTTSLVAAAAEPLSRMALQANSITVGGAPAPEFVLGMGLVH